jgi:hypothetical protein
MPPFLAKMRHELQRISYVAHKRDTSYFSGASPGDKNKRGILRSILRCLQGEKRHFFI